jgi:hypothetical protein
MQIMLFSQDNDGLIILASHQEKDRYMKEGWAFIDERSVAGLANRPGVPSEQSIRDDIQKHGYCRFRSQ